MIKHFDRNHHGYQSLVKAHATMLRSGDYINENKKQKENAERVQDLQSNTTGWTSKDVRRGRGWEGGGGAERMLDLLSCTTGWRMEGEGLGRRGWG